MQNDLVDKAQSYTNYIHYLILAIVINLVVISIRLGKVILFCNTLEIQSVLKRILEQTEVILYVYQHKIRIKIY
jgi:hypothetical protein